MSRPVKGATFLGFVAALAVSRSPWPVADAMEIPRSFPADPAFLNKNCHNRQTRKDSEEGKAALRRGWASTPGMTKRQGRGDASAQEAGGSKQLSRGKVCWRSLRVAGLCVGVDDYQQDSQRELQFCNA